LSPWRSLALSDERNADFTAMFPAVAAGLLRFGGRDNSLHEVARRMEGSMEALLAQVRALKAEIAALTAAAPPAAVIDGAAVEEFDADSEARQLAGEIHHDMFVLGSLEHQRRALWGIWTPAQVRAASVVS
jgi:hypothetical protein